VAADQILTRNEARAVLRGRLATWPVIDDATAQFLRSLHWRARPGGGAARWQPLHNKDSRRASPAAVCVDLGDSDLRHVLGVVLAPLGDQGVEVVGRISGVKPIIDLLDFSRPKTLIIQITEYSAVDRLGDG